MGATLLFCFLIAADTPLEFNRDVRPILSDKCFQCHGPDAKAKGIPLRLDQEEDAKRRAIVPGNPDQSPLIQRITADKPARRMPPPYAHLALNPREIETLRRWVAEGAPWQRHWAFLPPRKVEIAGGGHPVDAFVRARLAREGLAMSPRAEREILLRRVSLDLTGLPPTPAETEAFAKDQRPDAYLRAVDRLLASPRFGERMAARWLDAARYADSNGYQFDGERVMWRWRDYVIDSFNRNKPFSRFIEEQIAGDLLPDATFETRLATGFNRNHRINTEDGIIPEEYAVEYVIDRVETTSAVFLGLTMGCARCHNHKYDPLSQREFYQMFAFFNNVPELGRGMKYGNSPPVMPAPTAAQQVQLAALEERLGKEQKALARQEAVIVRAQAVWEKTLGCAPPEPSAVLLDSRTDLSSSVFDGKNFVELPGKAAFDIDDPFTLVVRLKPEKLDGSIVSRMNDTPRAKGYGIHLDQGRIHVNLTSNWDDDAIRVETKQPLAAGREVRIAVTYDGSVTAGGIRVYVDGVPQELKVLLDTLYRPFRNAGNPFRTPFRAGTGWGPQRRFVGRISEVAAWKRVLDPEEISIASSSACLNEIAAKTQRTPVENRMLREAFLARGAAPEISEAWRRLQSLRTERELLVRTFPTAMVMAESTPRKAAHVLERGQYDKRGEAVMPGVPAVLPPLDSSLPADRLALARWLTSAENPLTARVTVNRFWQMLFGTGLVKTTEDFGQQGEWPSHSELLDWLAVEFRESGWDVKHILKLIVTSETYQQTGAAPKSLLERDPENRLLARGPRVRLPAELIRDQALAVSGLLKERIGGPSVKPYQPAGLWKEITMQDMDYVPAQGDDLWRRSLYTFWKRTVAPPMLTNFDAANRETCVVRETRTNTPLQALNLMNDPTFLEAGRFLGQRMLREGGGDDRARLRYGFRLATARWPREGEEKVLLDSLRFHRGYFSEAARASSFLAHGEAKSDSSLPPRELAAYAAVGNLLLNLDEVITKP
ncbi:MAG: DUF1553 domain-containing protein [Bryobacter sp.]|nr:DUF1553 domain-containing protein [Bryobacter sp.]